MQQYYLKITSNNEKSLRHFLHLFRKHLKAEFNIIQKSVLNKNKRKIVTLLKSPHVNKTAQEHFEVRVFTKHLRLKVFYFEKHLIILKKIFNKLFQDISVRLEFVANGFTKQNNNKLTFYPDNFRLFFFKQSKANIKRRKRNCATREFCLEKKPLFSLTEFLNTISIFSEILILSRKR